MSLARWLKLANFLVVVPLLTPPSIGVCGHCLAVLSVMRTVAAGETSASHGGCSKCKSQKDQTQSPVRSSCCSKNPSDSNGVAHWERSPETAHDFWACCSAKVVVRAPAHEFAASALIDQSESPRGSPPVFQLISLLRI